MKNVYEEVAAYYTNHGGAIPLPREWTEGFLRQQAWLGVEDAGLREIWRQIRLFLQYLISTESEDLDDLSAGDFNLVIEWISGHSPRFKTSVTTVRRFFGVLIKFYRFLAAKKLVRDSSAVEQAAESIAGGRKVRLSGLPGRGDGVSGLDRLMGEGMPEENLEKRLAGAVEGLMRKLGTHFQRAEFLDDFHRALFFFTGPYGKVPELKADEFWLGFWDYFLFDYHLLASDRTPLEYFSSRRGGRLTADERQVLEELLHAEFTIFYIARTTAEGWAECVNLLTEDRFLMPHPGEDARKLRRQLFFGHIFSRGRVLINYITSVGVSPNLRRRIRQEIERQRQLLKCQLPDAGWSAFLGRHALAVRHTIGLLVTLPRLNLMPPAPPEKGPHACEISGETVSEDDKTAQVRQILEQVMPEYGFSRHDMNLAARLWQDYRRAENGVIRKPEAWAAAVICAYSQINGPTAVSGTDLASGLGVSVGAVYQGRRKIEQAVRYLPYDPRYLSEEGLLFLLCTS